MSKYDSLDARSELEQAIASDLDKALRKREWKVRHNGTATTHAPAGKPDIEVFDDQIHINVEVTKSIHSAQDREWLSIKDHFEETKKNNIGKKCFMLFLSPSTHYRTIDSIKDWNFAHQTDPDLRVLPLCFSTFETIVTKFIESTKEQFPKKQLLALFSDFVQFIDDESIFRYIYEELFPTDGQLKGQIERAEDERHELVISELMTGFKQLEQKLRDEMVALAGDAIKNVIYLVFIKLYEEKKEKEEGQRNRFTLKTFGDYQEYVRDKSKAIHKLFDDIKNDKGLRDCGLFTDEDALSDRLKDEFVIDHFIKPFEPFTFYTAKVDGLGAAYEVLGELSKKDRTVGQFFTPENVVRFMVKMADLHQTDVVYDPACGTARFLTNAMQDMESRVKGARNEDAIVSRIRKTQLFGTDDDPTVARLAKMNMYIHGDGKTNIKDEDGLTQLGLDGKIDVVLTNPPLGDLDYWRSIYNDDFRLHRMEVVPRKNLTEARMTEYKKRLRYFEGKLDAPNLTGKKMVNIEKKVQEYTNRIAECGVLIRDAKSEFEITGKQMKGGALFTNAAWHYLKGVRDTSDLPEWKGGKLLIILDEGVLNTDDYKSVREYIRRHFYVKAVVSLTEDTFVPVSHTSTKTSILYAIKKEDPNAVQQEPIFFAHAQKVGINTRRKICANHLFNSGNDILSHYREFEEMIRKSYEGQRFVKSRFIEQNFEKGMIDD
jgi:type I restriction-modification system DNA methylase subunit